MMMWSVELYWDFGANTRRPVPLGRCTPLANTAEFFFLAAVPPHLFGQMQPDDGVRSDARSPGSSVNPSPSTLPHTYHVVVITPSSPSCIDTAISMHNAQLLIR